MNHAPTPVTTRDRSAWSRGFSMEPTLTEALMNHAHIRHLAWLILLVVATPFAAAQDEDEYHADLLEGSELMAEVYWLLMQNYAIELDPIELARAAVRGMTGSLDRYTTYVTEEENRRLPSSRPVVTVGLEVVPDDGELLVVEVADGYEGGEEIRPGDRILAIDSLAVAGRPLAEIAEIFASGPEGSHVALDIRRGNRMIVVDLVRRRLLRRSLAYMERLPDSTLYIRIDRFGDDLPAAFRTELLRIGRYEARTAPLRGVVLDLRGNRGGFLEPAVRVAEMLLPSGSTVARIENGRGEEMESYVDTDPDLLPAQPIVVLVDRETASSAELLAAALADNRRAVILGEGTYGKGLVQESDPLSAGGFLRTTTGWYITPSGYSPDRDDRLGVEADTLLGTGGLRPDSVITDRGLLLVAELARHHLFLRFASVTDRDQSDRTLLPAFHHFLLEHDPTLLKIKSVVDRLRRELDGDLAMNEGWDIMIAELTAQRRITFKRNAAALEVRLRATLRDLEQEKALRREGRVEADGMIAIAREMARKLWKEQEGR